MNRLDSMQSIIHHVLVAVLSVVFISAGSSKIMSLDFIVEKIKYLPFLVRYEEEFVYRLALALSLLEIFVGVFVWLRAMRLTMLSVIIILLVFFICFTIYLNVAGVLTNCPCFTFLKERVMNWQVVVQDNFLILVATSAILTDPSKS